MTKRTRGSETFLCGAAMADITPELGTQLDGDIGRCRPAESITDPLYARAMVLEGGGKRIGILAVDLCVMSNAWAAELRRRVGERCGLEGEALAIHCIQNHAAPSLGHLFVNEDDHLPDLAPEHPWLWGGDDRYSEPAAAAMVEAVAQAAAAMQPVGVAAARGVDGRVAFNRRFILRDGSAVCHPKPHHMPEILQSEGPIDPEVGVMTFTADDGQVVATILHHSCHPCHGFGGNAVIGDWPSAWGEQMRQRFGPQCVPVTLNGCCGNIHHCNHLDPHAARDYRLMAEKLAETSDGVLGRMQPQPAGVIDYQRTVLDLPMRKLTAEEIDWAQTLLAEHPEPVWKDEIRVEWDWVYAVSMLDLHEWQKTHPTFHYEIQAFRIGDCAVVTLMGEPFVEGQLEIKRRSPAAYTFVAHLCSGYAGYIPTAKAFEGGGYETRTSNGSRFRPDTLETIAAESVKLLESLF